MMGSMMKAQISMEYLMLIGLAMMLIVPSVYLYSERQKTYQSEMVSAQVNQAGDAIIDNVRTIYSLGKGSKSIVEVNLPKGVGSIGIVAGRELVFTVLGENGYSDLIYTCYFCKPTGPTLNGTFTMNDTLAGLKTFQIKACSNFILIERVVRNTTGDFVSTGPNYNC